jgi:aryl-alcohol dehydrogenase (NADP+)
VRLGATGLLVSRLCLGTATFGVQCDERASHQVLDRAAELGITFLDTADKYPLGGTVETAGVTESIVGRWLRGRRDDVVIATKFHGRTGPHAWDEGSSRKHILSAVDASLRRLGTDYIDLYQAHRPDPLTPIDETLAALDSLVTAGKVRYAGCSNFLAYQVARAIGRSELLGLHGFVSVQPCYNLLFRQFERELLPLCREEGLAVLPYNVLAGGLLTGKHDRTLGPTPGTRFRLGTAADMYQQRYWQDRDFDAVDAVVLLAAEAGLPPVTLAVAWVLANDIVTAPIIGASRPDQLEDNVAAVDVVLDADLRLRLDELTAQFRRGDAVE